MVYNSTSSMVNVESKTGLFVSKDSEAVFVEREREIKRIEKQET